MISRSRFIVSALLLASGAFASAQKVPGQWVGDKYFVTVESGSGKDFKSRKYFIDEKNNMADPHEYGSSLYSFWLNDGNEDALYTISLNIKSGEEKGSLHESFSYRKWQDGEWSLLGEYCPPEIYKSFDDYVAKGIVNINIFPCENNRLIAITKNKDLESVHTNNRIGYHRKIDEPSKDYVQLVISGKNLAEPLQAQKKALNLVPLFV